MCQAENKILRGLGRKVPFLETRGSIRNFPSHLHGKQGLLQIGCLLELLIKSGLVIVTGSFL